ncbi:heterokaryon incompatibility protein [Colletotrichum scovillei]|uniref:Heterokaryon incompatibility protein n=1 Tax=Colletotrichum scovillei TaxID=1209932 RepID=A0A9P7R218_9PEZI|nr:heterokaryon incompatibility protein [Colletotrichum scovillei]KAG7059668.1 heterokaryon incompatibility protein [Colletotrichum scovillei]KAG7067118.1 heterokaryon incompatibility protein [Colletotrichum scovillei]
MDFEAVSYARKTSCASKSLIMRASTSNGSAKVILISSQVASLLFTLRDPAEMRTLWIYEVCVDQVNSSEKSTHIKPLRQVFESPVRVIFWLGFSAEDERSDPALTVLKRNAMHREYNDQGEYLGG